MSESVAAAACHQKEENSGEVAPVANDDGRGARLRSVNLNSESDMQEVHDALAVKGPGPKLEWGTW